MTLSTDDAFQALDSVLEPDGAHSQYIAAFRTKNGRHLALDRQASVPTLFLEEVPEDASGFEVLQRYASTDTRNSNLNKSRGGRLAFGNPAVRVRVNDDDSLRSLLDWYRDSTPTVSETAMCLLGTWRDFGFADRDRLIDAIQSNGGWASWWSFRIREDAHPLLTPPFWLYINRGGNQIVARFKVAEMVTSPTPIPSPWPSITDADYRDKTSSGDSASEVFKTWLRIVDVEMLDAPLKSTDFKPADGLSIESSLLNQSVFGYGYRKSTVDKLQSPAPAPVSTAQTQNAEPSAASNTILYGPPGTSKTYETIQRALDIIDPAFLAGKASDRAALKTRFDALRAEGRIEFVTFHQSYSYEDFIEGIRASTDDGKISYQVEDGVFKRLCTRAAARGGDDRFRSALDEFKHRIADEPVQLQTKTGRKFSLTWRGGKTLRLKPQSSETEDDYPVSVDHIERAFRGESEDTFYNVSYVRAVLAHVVKEWSIPAFTESKSKQPYVLIIDEINRGNIANIFGELITLIEPSKRVGAVEGLTATLPYSKEAGGAFGVPDNLHIIGTMNTADRSLARLDTALRRRFEFVPMYPQPQLLDGVLVEGIDIGRMLRRINERIELLYDRDHQIGHAFFLPLRDAEHRTLESLAGIFRRNVLPLLEEYFFEDWQKIRLVLGDNQKPTAFQFVREKDLGAAQHLFGDDAGNLSNVSYFRNDEAFKAVDSYRGIYGPT